MAEGKRPNSMEVDVIRPGDLADDERTETERSPLTEKKISILVGEADIDNKDDHSLDNGSSEAGAKHLLKPTNGEGADDMNGQRMQMNANSNSKKHRRGKTKGGKRHWKPYNKLSWEERRVLDERETRRAQRKRQRRFANGQPMAPYNTTQFLMEQHQAEDPDYNIHDSLRCKPEALGDAANGSGSVDSSEEYLDSPEDDVDDLFMAKDFSETYDNVHAERLQNMTKEELVRELIDMESRLEEKKSKDDSAAATSSEMGAPLTSDIAQHLRSTSISQKRGLEQEIARLRSENERLRQENARLRSATGSAADGSRSPSA